jgi:uncharacterized membrane protein
MSDTPARPPRRISFWMTISLLFNLLLLGLVVGMLVRQVPETSRRDDRPRFARDIDPETRRAMFGLMRESYRESRSERDARNEARARLADALKADPFDAEEARAAFEGLRTADNAVHATTHQAMIARLETLPPEQRRAMADLLARGPERDQRNRRNPPSPQD